MKPLSGFLWLWVHGTGQGKTPGLVRGPSIPSQPPRAGCSPMGPASPSRPSSSPLDLCHSLLTLCSPSPRLPCFYLGLCQRHCLGKKLRLAHLVGFFFFFLLYSTINSPQLFAWHSRPPQTSPTYLPSLITLPSALTPPQPRRPPPCTSRSLTLHSLSFLPGTPSLPSSLGVRRESLLPCCLLWEAVPDCTQGEVGTVPSRHPLIHSKGQGTVAPSVSAPTYCNVFNKL